MIKQGLTRHIFFWLLYLAWQSYAEYLFASRTYSAMTFSQQWQSSIIIESILLPLKIGLCYFSTILIASRYPSGKKEKWQGLRILLLIFIVCISILIHRWISNYIAYPFVLKEPVEINFWGASYLTSSSIDMLTILGLFNLVRFYEFRSVVEKDREIARKEKLESELHFLRSQINPHFLFNTLNNIYVLAKKQPENAPEAIHRLANLLRFILYECDQKLINLDKELEFLHDYVKLQYMRYKPEKLKISISKLKVSQDWKIAPMILLPILENAFKHGSSESESQSMIKVDISMEDDIFSFIVHNSHEKNPSKVVAGIGLSNVRKRLDLLYKDYNFETKDMGDFFIAKLIIHLNSYESSEMSYPRG